MKLENKGLAVILVAVTVVVAIGGVAVFYFGSVPPEVVGPRGSFSTVGPAAGSYTATFTLHNDRTAAYTVTGAWTASAPVQVILAEVLGLNMAGCGSYPINYPSGSPHYGCWPTFNGSLTGTVSETFHIRVSPQNLPTGSLMVIFRSMTPATVTVIQPFVVQESGFPQSACPSSPT